MRERSISDEGDVARAMAPPWPLIRPATKPLGLAPHLLPPQPVAEPAQAARYRGRYASTQRERAEVWTERATSSKTCSARSKRRSSATGRRTSSIARRSPAGRAGENPHPPGPDRREPAAARAKICSRYTAILPAPRTNRGAGWRCSSNRRGSKKSTTAPPKRPAARPAIPIGCSRTSTTPTTLASIRRASSTKSSASPPPRTHPDCLAAPGGPGRDPGAAGAVGDAAAPVLISRSGRGDPPLAGDAGAGAAG